MQINSGSQSCRLLRSSFGTGFGFIGGAFSNVLTPSFFLRVIRPFTWLLMMAVSGFSLASGLVPAQITPTLLITVCRRTVAWISAGPDDSGCCFSQFQAFRRLHSFRRLKFPLFGSGDHIGVLDFAIPGIGATFGVIINQ